LLQLVVPRTLCRQLSLKRQPRIGADLRLLAQCLRRHETVSTMALDFTVKKGRLVDLGLVLEGNRMASGHLPGRDAVIGAVYLLPKPDSQAYAVAYTHVM
jgi:hypothetical protein